MDKEDVVYIHNGISAIKKNEIISFAATWMDLEIIILSEVSRTGWQNRNIYCVIKKYKTVAHIYNGTLLSHKKERN